MKHIFIFALCVTFFLSAKAQESTVSTGGNITGSGGSISYSIGQPFFTVKSGTNGKVSEGVQHPYEIFIITGVEHKEILLDLSVYPNPTSDFLTLDVADLQDKKLKCELVDASGKTLWTKTIISKQTEINMQSYPGSNYLLNVSDNKKIAKTFKILKH